LLFQPGAKQRRFDVAVIVPVAPVAEIGIAQRVAEQGDDAILGFLLDLADGGHPMLLPDKIFVMH